MKDTKVVLRDGGGGAVNGGLSVRDAGKRRAVRRVSADIYERSRGDLGAAGPGFADSGGGKAVDAVRRDMSGTKADAVGAPKMKTAETKAASARITLTEAAVSETTKVKRGGDAIRRYGRTNAPGANIQKANTFMGEALKTDATTTEAATVRITETRAATEATTARRGLDESAGKAGARLSFREREAPYNGKLQHGAVRPGGGAVSNFRPQAPKSDRDADDNSGVDAVRFVEDTAVSAARFAKEGYRWSKLRPHRAALRTEGKVIKANANALYERRLRTDTELRSASPVQKAWQKRKIKREYARAFRDERKSLDRAKQTAQKTKKAAERAKEAVGKAAAFVARHWKGLALFGGALLMLVLLFSGISSCMSMLGGGFNAVIGTSYTAEDADINGAEADYAAYETQLAARVANIESEYPGYDEYRYNLDQIGHDPFELASYLTAIYHMYTRGQVQSELAALFSRQYALTVTPITETRYRTETYTDSYTVTDPVTGAVSTEYYSYEVEVAYTYYILNVSLVNRSLGGAAIGSLTPEQAEMYAVYMETKGNRPELFAGNVYVGRGEYTDYDIPPEALTDAKFAAMVREAEKHLGMAYVWGGSSPSSGFDCSGFVCWVINQSGVGSVGRTTAQGLFEHCAIIPPSEAMPGDLIFFHSTYDTPGASHVGIYVGGNMMIHCGNPISFASVTSDFWVRHFLAYGRLP